MTFTKRDVLHAAAVVSGAAMLGGRRAFAQGRDRVVDSHTH
jgi:hypothetical protein